MPLATALSLRAFADSGFSAGIVLLLLTQSSMREAALHAVLMLLVTIALAPIGGVLADRYSPARFYLLMSFIEAAICAAYGVVLFSGDTIELTAVVALSLISGAVSAFSESNSRIVLAASSAGTNRAQQLARIRLFVNLGRAIAPAIASGLTLLLSPQLFFAIIGLITLLPGVIVYLCRSLLVFTERDEIQAAGTAEPGGHKRNSVREALRYLRFAPWLIVLGLTGAVYGGAWLAGFRYAAADHYLAAIDNAATWGFVLSAFNFGLLFGTFVARFVRLRGDIFWAAVFPGMLALPLLSFYLTASPAAYIATAFIAGIIFDFTIIYGQSALFEGIPERILGTASSFISITEQLGIAAAYALLLVAQSAIHSFILYTAIAVGGSLVISLIILAAQISRRRAATNLPAGDARQLWTAEQWVRDYKSLA